MHPLLVLVSMSLFGVAGAPKADAAKQDTRLEGTWTVVSWTEDLEDKTARIQSLSFAAGKLTVKLKGGKKDVEGTYQVIDSAKKPATIKIRLIQEVLGIYEFGDNTLKLCLAEPRQEAPNEFKATFDSTLIVLKRQHR